MKKLILAVCVIAMTALYGCGSGNIDMWPTELESEGGCQPGQLVDVAIGTQQGGAGVSKYIATESGNVDNFGTNVICTDAATSLTDLTVTTAKLMVSEDGTIYTEYPFDLVGEVPITVAWNASLETFYTAGTVRCEALSDSTDIEIVLEDVTFNNHVTIAGVGEDPAAPDGFAMFAYMVLSPKVEDEGLDFSIDDATLQNNGTTFTSVQDLMSASEWATQYAEFSAAMVGAGLDYLFDSSYDELHPGLCVHYDGETCDAYSDIRVKGRAGTQLLEQELDKPDFEMNTNLVMKIRVNAYDLRGGLNVVGSFAVLANERTIVGPPNAAAIDDLSAFIPLTLSDEMVQGIYDLAIGGGGMTSH